MKNEGNEIIDKGRRRFIGTAIVAIPGAAVVSAELLAFGNSSAQSTTAGPAKEPAVIGYPNKKGVTIERVSYKARNLGTDIVRECLQASRVR